MDGSTCTFTMVRQAVAVAAVFTASKTTSTDGTLKSGTNTVTYRQGMGTGQGVISGPMGGLKDIPADIHTNSSRTTQT